MPACAHDGSRPGEVFANGTVACQDCVCKGHWDPAYDCSECGLVCFNKGFRDDDCTFCTCPVGGGYHGSNCHCRHAYMSFVVLAEKLPFTAAGAVSADERANLLASFSSTFASELRTAVGAAKVAAEAHIEEQTSPKGKRHFIFSFRVGPECPAVPAASASGAVVDTEMLSTYAGITLLKRSLSNNNHLATSALSLMNPTAGFGAHDPNCRLPGDECPTGWRKNGVYVDEEGTGGGDEPGSHETKPGSDGLSTGAIVGIAVGGSIFLFILIGVIASACLGLLCFAGKKSRMDQNST